MKKLKPIPKFKNSSQEEKFWATHDSAEYIDYGQAEIAFFPELNSSNRTISLRLPESLLESVKLLPTSRMCLINLYLKSF